MRKLVGYNPGDSVERIHYIKRADVAECDAALRSIDFPKLDLAPYNARQFEAYLDRAKAKAKSDEQVRSPPKKKRWRPTKSESIDRVAARGNE